MHFAHLLYITKYAKMLVRYERKCCYQKQSDGFGKLRWIFTIPILMGEPCLTGVSLF